MYSLVNKKVVEFEAHQINKEYQMYFMFVIILISLQLICNTIEPIILNIGLMALPASALFYVFSFTLCDVITENFGFKLAVRATLLNVVGQLIYCGVACIVYFIPKKFESTHAADSFQYIFHFLSFEFFGSIFSLLISMTINDYLINRLKLIFLGKGFWWRTIVSTLIGEIIMLNIDYSITFFGEKNWFEIQQIIFSALGYKVLAAVVLAFPAAALSRAVGQHIVFLKPPSLNKKTPLIIELKNALLFR